MAPQEIDDAIVQLATTLLSQGDEPFEKAAQTAGPQLTSEDLVYLKGKLHNPPEALPDTPTESLGLGQWMALCQYVIFELVFRMESGNKAFLEEIAYGEYDWTQATALEVMCRLHVEGKLPSTIVQEIDEKLAEMRYETHLYFSRALFVRAKRDERYAELIRQFKDKEFQGAIAELNSDSN